MELTDLKNTLAELEENLRNIDSARKQVLHVTKSSDDLTVSTKELINTFNKLYEKLEKETLSEISSVLQKFYSTVHKYDNEINKIISESKSEMHNQLKIMTELTNAFKEDIEKIAIKFENESLKKINENIRNKFDTCNKQNKVIQKLLYTLTAISVIGFSIIIYFII
jgi:chromatin segregation and condensation protein Rec8/ScpA/Scc1 (kleisin family)